MRKCTFLNKFLCAVYGHKWPVFSDEYAIKGVQTGLSLEVKTCYRCGKKAYRFKINGMTAANNPDNSLTYTVSMTPIIDSNLNINTEGVEITTGSK